LSHEPPLDFLEDLEETYHEDDAEYRRQGAVLAARWTELIPVNLDWRKGHWAYRTALPCQFCGLRTNLLDAQGRPAHKVCVEKLLLEIKRSDNGSLIVFPKKREKRGE